MTFVFDLRFRNQGDEAGCGNMQFHYDVSSRSLSDAVMRAVREVGKHSPDIVFDSLTYFSNPE